MSNKLHVIEGDLNLHFVFYLCKRRSKNLSPSVVACVNVMVFKNKVYKCFQNSLE